MNWLKRVALVAILSLVALMGCSSSNMITPKSWAGGNVFYSLTHSNWVDIHEGELGSTIADSCNDCFWQWQDYHVTWHGNDYHERFYNNNKGGTALVFFRVDSSGNNRVGWKTYWCGTYRDFVPTFPDCDEMQDFTN